MPIVDCPRLGTSKAQIRLCLLSATAVAGLLLTNASARAQTWNGGDGQYGSAANWTPNEVPDTAGEGAIFEAGGVIGITVSGTVSPLSWTFAANASGYTIENGTVSFASGGGLINNATANVQDIRTMIAGDGAVQQSGSGTLRLSGLNTYTGGTWVTGGTLQVDHNNALGTGAVTLTGGVLSFHSAAYSLANDFVLNGNAEIRNNGTITGSFSGAGHLTVSSGSLVIGPGSASTNTGRVIINAGATLTANAQTGSGSAGAIGNQASVEVNGTLGIAGGAAGGETIGSLEGGTTGTVHIAPGVSLWVGENNRSTTYGGQITGTAATGLRKTGTGRMALTGNNSGFGGVTAIYDGTIELSGQLGGTIIANGTTNGVVTTRGTLAGTGTAMGMVIIDTNLAPGTSGGADIGTLNVNQAVFGNTSIYYVTVNAAGQSDLLNVTGSSPTTLDGSVSLNPQAGVYALGTQYTILRTTAAANFGSTAFNPTVLSNGSELTFVTPVLSYNSARTEVYVTLGPRVSTGGDGGETPAVRHFSTAAITPNQIAAANASFELGYGNRIFNTIAVQNAADARRAFDALSGEVNASAAAVASNDALLHGDAVLDRLRAGSATNPQVQAALSSTAQAYAADLPSKRGAAAPVIAPRPSYSVWARPSARAAPSTETGTPPPSPAVPAG